MRLKSNNGQGPVFNRIRGGAALFLAILCLCVVAIFFLLRFPLPPRYQDVRWNMNETAVSLREIKDNADRWRASVGEPPRSLGDVKEAGWFPHIKKAGDGFVERSSGETVSLRNERGSLSIVLEGVEPISCGELAVRFLYQGAYQEDFVKGGKWYSVFRVGSQSLRLSGPREKKGIPLDKDLKSAGSVCGPIQGNRRLLVEWLGL